MLLRFLFWIYAETFCRDSNHCIGICRGIKWNREPVEMQKVRQTIKKR